MTVQIPTYLPLPAAARKFGIAEKILTRLVQDGRIEAAKLPSGELLVAEHEIDQSLNISRDQFEHLRGQPISMSEASRKYSTPEIKISQTNFSHWAKAGYITVLERGKWKVLIDEADAAYCAAVYKAKFAAYGGQLTGVRVFDKDGNPYRLKYPEVAAQMRAERRRKWKAAANNGPDRQAEEGR